MWREAVCLSTAREQREHVAHWVLRSAQDVREARAAVELGRRGARQRYARALLEADVATEVAEMLLAFPSMRVALA